LAGSRVQWDRAPRAHLAISRHENLSFVYAWYRLTHTYKECCVFSNMLSLLQAMSSTSRVFGVKGRERGNERFSEWKSLRGFCSLDEKERRMGGRRRTPVNFRGEMLRSLAPWFSTSTSLVKLPLGLFQLPARHESDAIRVYTIFPFLSFSLFLSLSLFFPSV
jgi:hypothetical protein